MQSRRWTWGLPWWLIGKESAYQCRRHRFNPWPGKIPHVLEPLSLCATATEPVWSRAWELQLLSPCSATTEAHTPGAHVLQLQSSPRSLQQAKSQHSTEDPAQPKINKAEREEKKRLNTKARGKKDELFTPQFYCLLVILPPFSSQMHCS